MARRPATTTGATPTAQLSTQDLTAASLVQRPRWHETLRARIAGFRDGRGAVMPDPATNLTPYLARMRSTNATMVESERLRRDIVVSQLDQQRAVLLTQCEDAQRAVTRAATAADGEGAGTADQASRVRAARRAEADLGQARDQLRSAASQLAALDSLLAHRRHAAALRIQRCTQRSDQLAATYWRSLHRSHPEKEEIRGAYPLPALTAYPEPTPTTSPMNPSQP